MAAPIPLISWNPQTKHFDVNPDAANALAKLNGPVAVVAVCGRARQGKSFLLNQLLTKLGSKGAAQGFQVTASSQRPCYRTIAEQARSSAGRGRGLRSQTRAQQRGSVRASEPYVRDYLFPQVGPTTKPCTKGLWLWSAPVVRTTATGQRYNLVGRALARVPSTPKDATLRTLPAPQ